MVAGPVVGAPGTTAWHGWHRPAGPGRSTGAGGLGGAVRRRPRADHHRSGGSLPVDAGAVVCDRGIDRDRGRSCAHRWPPLAAISASPDQPRRSARKSTIQYVGGLPRHTRWSWRLPSVIAGPASLLGECSVSLTPSHDEHLLDDQRCSCGSSIMYRRRVIMGEHDREMTFAAWCQNDPDHRLPEAMIREIAELRSELGPLTTAPWPARTCSPAK